jgi:general stress protein CsbA
VTQIRADAGIRHLLLAAGLGVAAGVFVAWAYYTTGIRDLAHSFTIWVGLLVAVAARREPKQAATASVVALIAGVLCFYFGRDVIYDLKYPASSYGVDPDTVILWCVLAVVAGVVLGVAFSRIGREDWPGAIITAGAAGLLLADTYRKSQGTVDVGMIVATCLALLVIALSAHRSRAQLRKVVILLLPGMLAGYVLVSAPDVLEEMVRFL